MGKTLALISIYFIVLLAFNANLSKLYLDDKTKYKNQDMSYGPGWLVMVFLVFGIFLIFFIKPLKRLRKINYYKNKLRQLKFCGFYNYNKDIAVKSKEIKEIERFLKLDKIRRKSKWMFIK
jgi:hypothetical protein